MGEVLEYERPGEVTARVGFGREWAACAAATAGGKVAGYAVFVWVAGPGDPLFDPVMGFFVCLLYAILCGVWAAVVLTLRLVSGWRRQPNVSENRRRVVLLILTGVIPTMVAVLECMRHGWAMEGYRYVVNERVLNTGWMLAAIMASVVVLWPRGGAKVGV